MKVLEKELARIYFSNTKEREEFFCDVKVLLESSELNRLVYPETLKAIYLLYLKLSANINVFDFIWSERGLLDKESNVLFNFFSEVSGNELSFPKSLLSTKIFIKFCDTNIEQEDLRKILESKILDYYSPVKIKMISKMYLQNAVTLIRFFSKYAPQFSKKENILVLDVLSLLEIEINENTVDDIFIFLKNIVPCFKERFAHLKDEESLFSHTEKVVDWFIVWRNHYYLLEESEKDLSVYYEIDFSTIVKYIPEYIWWNNGVIYHGKNKHFQFGSYGFFFLATGGSIRKFSDERPYTRRMAREFVQLRYDLDLGENHDVYLYLFGKSLGGGEKLSRALMGFMRHSKKVMAIQKEFDKWNPVVQKFSSDEIEILCDEAIQTLMGYIYHCLRDKSNYSIQGKSIVDIMHESDTYYRRILDREVERQQRAILKAQKNEDPKVVRWNPCRRIKPYLRVDVSVKAKAVGKFNIVELLNEQQLAQEGKVLQHCVGTYTNACMKSSTSIWSLRHFEKGGWRSKVTIEVRGTKIVQMRGKCNQSAKENELAMIQKWAAREALVYN